MNERARENFKSRCAEVAADLLSNRPARVVLLHHNDTDGLTSGAILSAAFERIHMPLFRYCLEKPYPGVLEQIFANPLLEPDSAILFVDFASGMLPAINEINRGRFRIFVLDHHAVHGAPDAQLTLLNCNEAGINGSAECSASSVAYLFACSLSEDNTDLLAAALLGGFGDSHFSEYSNAQGVHAELYARALEAGIIDKVGIFSAPHEGAGSHIVSSIDALGSFGYFHGGPDIAVKGILEGVDARYHAYGSEYRKQYETALERFLAEDPLRIEGPLAWFSLPDTFSAFGVKTVGLVCQQFADTDRRCKNSYILGFQRVPDRIPGIGDLPLNQIKLSMRVGAELRPAVLAEKAKTIQELIPEAAKGMPSFVDACHKQAGAATVAPGCEQQFVAALLELLKN